MLRESTGEKKIGCSTLISLVPWPLRIGAESMERPQQVVCSRVKNVTREFDEKKRRKNVI